MAEQVQEKNTGEGYAVAHLDAMGEGPGYRKIRRELEVTAFGVNAIVLPPRYRSGRHYHDEQEELYFCYAGRLEMEFGDGSVHEMTPGTFARVDASTVREMRNPTDEEATYVIVGGKGGYVGHDGRLPEDEDPEAGERGASLD